VAARPGRRLGAVAVDWGLCVLIAYSLITDGYDPATTGNWALLIFFVLHVLTIGTVGFTPGKRLFGIARKGRIAVGYDADFTVVDMKRTETIRRFVPLVIEASRSTIRPMVVLPLPLSPMRETTSPGRTSRLTSRTAVRS
jgi:hypothetical protein